MAGGTILAQGERSTVHVDATEGALVTLFGFMLMLLPGVWHVFRKRGRIYI